MNGIFITSTGTDIGKTYLTQQLLAFDQLQGRQFSASKPVISGWPTNEKEIQHTDTGILLQVQQQAFTEENINNLSPWRFSHPLTPSMAAAKEGKKILLTDLVAHCQDKFLQAKQKNQIHLIEGVGGVMAPMGEDYTVLDWIQQLGVPSVLVVGSYLGTLSHTLTAIAVLQMKGITIQALVVNETQESKVALNDTIDCLESIEQTIPVFALPYKNSKHTDSQELARLYDHCRGAYRMRPYNEGDNNT